MAYSKNFKLRVLKHVKLGLGGVESVARLKHLPKQTIYRWITLFRKHGEAGLENKTPGAKETHTNETFEKLILALWTERNQGAHKIWINLKKIGFYVSERQIQKVYNKHTLKMNKRTRPSQIKFVKYEWPNPNDMWHTDWTICPFTHKYLIAFIDDHSRFIIHAEYFDKATTENTLIAFKKAIQKYGKPKSILTDNGAQFTPARAQKGPFTQWCEQLNIKHILGRIHHPQTNGKIERWFGTYKQEYKQGQDNLETFTNYYNQQRLHQGIRYQTPLQRYKSNINAV